MIFVILKQIKFHLLFWSFLILAIIPLFLVILFQTLRIKRLYIYFTRFTTVTWGRLSIMATGSTITVHGIENIPNEKNICYISNHQGNFDIPSILGSVKHEIGFVAKSSLYLFPIVGLWMKFMGCIFINRSNLKQSIKKIQTEIQYIANERPILVFPEGTRSRSNTLGEFQPGTIKMIGKVKNIQIVPITIKNSFKVFEEKHHIDSANIELYFHPPILTNNLSSDDIKNLPETLHSIIEKPLLA